MRRSRQIGLSEVTIGSSHLFPCISSPVFRSANTRASRFVMVEYLARACARSKK